MDIREYASGGKSTRLGITRHCNRYFRTALIEANQRGYRLLLAGKHQNKAKTACAREMVGFCLGVT